MGRQTNEHRLELILIFLKDYLLERGYAPNLREISAEIGVNSTSLVGYYLDQLQDRGKIKRTENVARSIVVL